MTTALHKYKSTNLLQYWIKSYSTPATKYWTETGLSTYYSTGQIQEHFNPTSTCSQFYESVFLTLSSALFFLGYSTLSLVLLSSLVVSIFNTAVFAADCMSKYFCVSGSNVCHIVTSTTLVCHSVVCVSSLTSSLVSLCHKASFNWCSGVSWTISLSCFELEYLFLNGMEMCLK